MSGMYAVIVAMAASMKPKLKDIIRSPKAPSQRCLCTNTMASYPEMSAVPLSLPVLGFAECFRLFILCFS